MCKVLTQTYVCVSVYACVQVYVCVYVCACVCFNRLYISYHLDYLNWLKASNTQINFCPQFRCRFCLVIVLHLQLLLFFYQSTLYRRKEYWFINSSYIMPIFLSIGFQFSVFPSVEFLYFFSQLNFPPTPSSLLHIPRITKGLRSHHHLSLFLPLFLPSPLLPRENEEGGKRVNQKGRKNERNEEKRN